MNRIGTYLVVCALGMAAGGARADFALTQDGDGLFNVRVEDNQSTWARPLRVISTQDSFRYDYGSNSIRPMVRSGRAEFFWISEIHTTSTTYGKAEARAFMASRGWKDHVPPPRMRVDNPPPPVEPTPIPTPTPTPDPKSLADESLPLGERVRQQMDIFIGQQEALSNRLRLARMFGISSTEDLKAQRLKLLQDQTALFLAYYPQSEEVVGNAAKELESQAESVRQTGRFRFE